ncbi:MAG: DJ-1 family glyoxalase III [Candidatus Omnitrophota bacterium]|jgi:4-methyl-5(b-hydroxyethyl)-thiazole monophosphate biosynthesis
MPKTALVILAEGFEEVEAVASIDVMRRAGLRVTIAGVTGLHVRGSRKIGVQADVLLKDIKDLPDTVVLPGGLPGATNLAGSGEVTRLVKKMNSAGKLVAAICAAPAAVLAPLGILDGKKATCYPGCESDFSPRTVYLQDRVVKDGNVITSRGPGSALEFALEIVRDLAGNETADLVRDKMLIKV